MKELEKQKTGLANRIKAVMGEYETGELDGIVVSWKKISRESVDSKKTPQGKARDICRIQQCQLI